MPQTVCRLETQWTDVPGTNGRLDFTLTNLGDQVLSAFKLTYTTLTRADDLSQTDNAELLSRYANNHLVQPPAGLALKSGESWSFAVTSLTRKGVHRTDGVSTAFLTFDDGTNIDVDTGDLLLGGATPELPPRLIPEGQIEMPLAMIPWPNNVTVSAFAEAPVALYPAEDAEPQAKKDMAEVTALAKRLFANAMPPFAFATHEQGKQISFAADRALGLEGYRLTFAKDGVKLVHGGDAGRFYGLVALAQMLHGAHTDPERFAFPEAGSIEDSPRYGWRGCHLDVSRQFYPMSDVARFVDILAWNRMNVFHWHLTDDEGWRLEIKAHPELTEIASRRGPDEKIPAQLGTGSKGTAGYYTQEEVRDMVATAGRMHIEIIPEFDVPGHCACVLTALPHLIDPEEEKDSYHSVQGYPNNALNPALEETFDFIETVFAEAAALFPSQYVHVGGDEVAHGAWMKSPKAQALMKEIGLEDTPQLQAYTLSRAKTALARHGKKLAGWDEVSHGGGVEPEGSLLMAWQKPEIGIGLAEQGYDVVMCPGQAYYLDMVQHDAWLEPGLSWAGTVSPEMTYTYEAEGDFPENLRSRLKGIQGCIWSENLTSKPRFNHMVFPRLSAIAEAGWTEKAHKDWQRFAALQALMPVL